MLSDSAPQQTTSLSTQDVETLLADNRLLAFAMLGGTPDRNTQTEKEVAETEAAIEAAIDRALPGLCVRG